MEITAIDSNENCMIVQTKALLMCYGFEIKGHTVGEIVEELLNKYSPIWLRLATIEAIYLGRYKIISVEQILSIWLRKGNPSYHFNHDFERLICRKLPEYLKGDRERKLPEKKHLKDVPIRDREQEIKFSQPIVKEKEKTLTFLEKTKRSNISLQTKNQKILNFEQEIVRVEIKNKDGSKSDRESVIPYKANWISSSKIQKSIERFTPLPDRSEFYLKLKAVAKKNLK